MSQLNVVFPDIADMVARRHAEFVERFGEVIAKLDGDHAISTARIKAKLELLVKAFHQSKVIDGVSYGVVSSRDGVFPMSLCLNRDSCHTGLYLLNTGKDVIVSDSVGLAQTISTLDSRIVLVTDTKRVCKRFSDVLNDDFDWIKMAEFVLDAVHEVMYDGVEARRMEWAERF